MGKEETGRTHKPSRLSRWAERASLVADQLPGSQRVRQRLEQAETRALKLLKSRLDRVDPRALPAPHGYKSADASLDANAIACPVTVHEASAASMLVQLLEEAGDQHAAQAREALYRQLVRQLVPDEARLLGALSDGSEFALVHVGTGNAIGGVTHRLMENLSAVGKACQVRLPDQVPDYIRHLRDLHLVETAEEDKALEVKYQILESDSKVMALEKHTRQKLRFIRRTLKISPLGRALWNHCMPGADGEDDA